MNSWNYFPDGIALSDGIELAASQGYSFVKNGLSETACAKLAMEAAGLQMELDNQVEHPINEDTPKEITQLHERIYTGVGSKEVPAATLITNALRIRALALRYRLPPLHKWHPNEIGYHLYRDENHHISKHTDRRTDEILAATITLNGSAKVGIHEAIDDPEDYTNTRQVDEFQADEGTIMFLRAPGLGSGEQVIHDVSPPEGGPRLVLNLRMQPNILASPSEMQPK